jgi:E3 ubiquitin-protein ligase DOA10
VNPPDQQTVENRIEGYWGWITVALFLLVTLDLLTSLYAAQVVGLEYESNPLMAWLLGQSLVAVITVHVAAVVLAAVFFYAIVELIRRTTPTLQWVMMRSLEIYLGLLIAVGLFVVANNLSVIVLRRSLL